MKMMGIHNCCIGCGAKEDDPECDCMWVTCGCGAWDCYLSEIGADWHCKNCGYCSNPDMY